MVRATPAAVHGHSADVECPVLDPELQRRLDACVAASQDFGRGILEFQRALDPPRQARWLKASVEGAQVLFQPWSLELLFVLAVLRRARYSQLQQLTGISSRTLSDKLQALREAGYVEREVFDEQPVRIEYRLSKEGKIAAALATPLVAHLNRETRHG